MVKTILVFFLFLFVLFNIALGQDYLSAKAKKGDGINNLLLRYCLPLNTFNINSFKKLNEKSLRKKESLITNKGYLLPVQIHKFDGKTIRSTLSINDLETAQKIEEYNKKLWRRGLKKSDYKKDFILLVPNDLYDQNQNFSAYSPPKFKGFFDDEEDTSHEKEVVNTILKTKSKSNKNKSRNLKGYVFYLDPGHGGPDPGAIGYKNGNELHEDEYAYDITLRLSKKLKEQGAKVYVLVKDDNDGIRNDLYLKGNYSEYYLGGDTISQNLLIRLRKRAEIVNRLYERNKNSAKHQYTITLHVDSRVNDKRIDIFFYYKENDNESRRFASTLLSTIEAKYNKSQPGRGYKGTVSTRSLHMLRNTATTSVYIELGNIQNPKDQYRILDPNNRQAIANWLCDGALKYVVNP